MKLEFTVGGLEKVITVIKRYEDLPTLLDPEMRKWVEETHQGRLAGTGQYPAERAGQRYQRTGQLGAGFRYGAISKSHYQFVNEVPYVRWVVGDSDGNGQSWMHRGRWFVARERVEAEQPTLVEKLEKALVEAAK